MSTENNAEKHPFLELSDIIDKYKKNRLSFDVKQLQDIREQISLTLFYLSDSASQALSQQEGADFDRKRHYAERIDFWKNETDEDGKRYTVAASEAKSRIDNEEYEATYVEATRKQQRVRIILEATRHIINSIASRLNNIQHNN